VSSGDGSGIFLVKTRFVLADASVWTGYCVPSPQSEDENEDVLGYVLPAICTDAGQVPFWFVRDLTSADQVDQVVDVAHLYAMLGRPSAKEVFPASFASDVPIDEADVASGTIDGFTVMGFVKGERRFVKTVVR
jgi:hypothetical protein